MGAPRAQLPPSTEDRASGAQVIDGSLIINKGENYLKRTPSSAGNQKTWTWSAWVKRDSIEDSTHQTFFSAGDGSVRTNFMFDNTGYTNPGTIQINYQAGQGSGPYSNAARRDYDGFYHIVVAFDTTEAAAADRIKCWVNGVEDVLSNNTMPSQDTEWDINTTKVHTIGMNCELSEPFGGKFSTLHFIDGQALDASYFGYTDPLTNTWRPKKFSGTYSGEYPLADYTGGLPILATNSLGTAVTSGTRADSNSANIVLAVPFNGNVTDYSATIKGSGSALVGSTDSITYPTTNDKYYGS